MKRRSDRLDELQSQRHALMLERIAALEQAERQAEEAHEAKRRVEALENPFSQRNLAKWVMQHGPNIFVIIAGVLMLRVVAKGVSYRVVSLMAHKGSGTRKERENRAQTIVGVFHNAATVVGYGGGTLMILEECGVPVGPLLGGAAVFGLAVAFGSQNLIRDYFYGFVILLENQYGVNDIVKIGEVTGQVERITLRMTVIRDSDGVNFIPNGQIASVKNLTHGWSQAAFDIAVDYKEDVDHVMDVLMELGRELRTDAAFSDKILNDPTMQGVDVLGDSAVTIKMSIKTRPFEQWTVKREMLRRVKKRFEERGIQLPMTQRTIVHRYSKSEDDPNRGDDEERWSRRKSA
jgi:small conductance mechanosensitive channel